MNIGDQQKSHKWQTSVEQLTSLTVGLPVTSERYWASFQVTRLFHKATVSHCDHFLLQHMYLLWVETSPGWSQGWRVFFFLTSIWWGSTQLQCIYYLCRILISRPPRVFRHFKRRSCCLLRSVLYQRLDGIHRGFPITSRYEVPYVSIMPDQFFQY